MYDTDLVMMIINSCRKLVIFTGAALPGSGNTVLYRHISWPSASSGKFVLHQAHGLSSSANSVNSKSHFISRARLTLHKNVVIGQKKCNYGDHNPKIS